MLLFIIIIVNVIVVIIIVKQELFLSETTRLWNNAIIYDTMTALGYAEYHINVWSTNKPT